MIGKCDPGCVNPESGLSPCRKCEKGQYISYMQSTFCMTCPEGQSTLSFENSSCGATNIADCKGTFMNIATCNLHIWFLSCSCVLTWNIQFRANKLSTM